MTLCSVVQCKKQQYGARNNSTVQETTVQCSTLQCSKVKDRTVHDRREHLALAVMCCQDGAVGHGSGTFLTLVMEGNMLVVIESYCLC